MTSTLERPETRSGGTPPAVPPHPHFTLGSLTVIGVVLGVVAALVGIGALYSVATQDAVDDEFVEMLVDERLGDAAAGPFGSVIPELVPKAQLALAPADEVHTAYAPNVPPPSGRTTQAIIEVNFEIVENVVAIDPATGVEFETWGYRLAGDSTVVAGTPGPMIRGRVGDLLRFTLVNPAGNAHSHNVDFHAVTGQGGGAADTLVAPGESKTIEARLLYPGIFMYHCAAGDVPSHIAHGMYGGILVDPAEPLFPAEQEFYVVQSEYYTTGTGPGLVELDRSALTDEHPTMVVFNGAKGALAGDNALQISVGERARFYFVNAGLNLDSNFHPIGSHWDAVWPEGATLNQPLRGSQTTLVPAGGGVVVDLVGLVPSNIILVDHALTRTFDKGAIGIVEVVGDADPDIFEATSPGDAPVDAPAVPDGDFIVEIPENAFLPQDLDDPSEFADVENPADYSVNVLRVPAGSTVVWTNADAIVHTVTSVDGLFDSGNLNAGASFSFTFDEPGEYEYFCLPHPWMRAKVIVEG